MRALLTFTALVALAVAVAGCGGSNTRRPAVPSPTSTRPLASAASNGTAANIGGRSDPGAPASRRHRARTASPRAHAGASAQAASAAVSSSTSPSVTSQPAVAKAPSVPPSFAAQADAVCEAYRHSVSTLHLSTSLTEQEKVVPTLLRQAHAAIARLGGLHPPAPDAAAFAAYTRLTSVAVDDFVQAQTKSRSTKESVGVAQMQRNMATYRALERVATAADTIARHLGMHVCGSAGSDWL